MMKNLSSALVFTPSQRLFLVSLTLLALALRLYRLETQSIWFDESLSALFAAQPLALAIRSMLEEGLHHSPLFYILLRPFAAGGFSEFSLRFLPAALGVLTIPLLAQVGRILAGSRVGVLAALMLVINPFHVWYSQEARMYTLLMLAAVGGMYFFGLNLTRPRRVNWLALAGCGAVGLNSHHFAVFVPLVQFIFILVTLKQNYRLLRPWVAAQVLVGLSLVPWLWIVLDWGHFYLSSASVQPPTGDDLLLTLWNFSIGYTGRVTPGVVIAVGLFAALVVLGVRASYRRTGGLLLLLWFIIPLLVTFLVSLRLPTYLDRYISLSLPPFLLLAAWGLNSLRQPVWRLAAAGLVFGFMLTGLGRVYYDTTVYNRADWRGVGVYLEKNAAPTDIIAPWRWQYLVPLNFYYHGDTPLQSIIGFNVVDVPILPVAGKLWVIIDHPNNNLAHVVGHCQEFDINKLPSLIAAKNWRVEAQSRLRRVVEFPCVRLEIYE